MTHEEAAAKLKNYLSLYKADSPLYPNADEREAMSCLLRSVASASADAEKAFEQAWKDKTTNPDTVLYISKSLAKHFYLAGHAAATAAKQSEVDVMCDEVVRLTKIKDDADSLVSLAWHRYGLRRLVRESDSDPHEYEKLLADLRSDRPPRVTEILAARKEQTT